MLSYIRCILRLTVYAYVICYAVITKVIYDLGLKLGVNNIMFRTDTGLYILMGHVLGRQ